MQERPWYRQKWVWFVLSGPIAVVLAAFATLKVVGTSLDTPVVDDYAKDGNSITLDTRRDDNALKRELSAVGTVASGKIRLRLNGTGPQPETLRLRMLHPGDAGKDQILTLRKNDQGEYETPFTKPATMPHRWMLQLEDTDRQWRLLDDWKTQQEVTLLFQPARNNQ